ncbi:MAG: glycosyltransferase family 1 protein [Chitinophagaceae bacterium]|nr:glycosyltransferase family 1 protein [Anaerolineae bacterium]
MTKFWFISAPLYSHTDWGGFMKTAQELQSRGHDVLWVSGAAIQAAVEQAGIQFRPISETGWLWPPPPTPDLTTITPQEAVMLRYRRALDTWLSEDIVGAAVQALIDLAAEIGKPDVIATDPFLSASALAAEKLDVPLVVCGWPAQGDLNESFLFPVQRTLGTDSQQRLARLCERFGLQGVNFSHGPTPSIISPHLHICYFTRGWYIGDEMTLLPQNLFVGGIPTPPKDAPPDWLTVIPQNVPIALITLGSVFTGDLGFFSWSAQAAAREGFIPLVVIGWNPIEPEKKAELVAALPKTTRLLNWVPFDHVLPRTKLMIHHGGMGTTHAAVLHGLPQIAVPHAADQRVQARRLSQARVGLNLTAHDVRHGMLWEGVKALSKDAKVQQTAYDLAAEMDSLGCTIRAADALEKIKLYK